jgi:hypothetical protein
MQAGRCLYQPPVFLRGFLELTFPEIRGVAAVVVRSVLGSRVADSRGVALSGVARYFCT